VSLERPCRSATNSKYSTSALTWSGRTSANPIATSGARRSIFTFGEDRSRLVSHRARSVQRRSASFQNEIAADARRRATCERRKGQPTRGYEAPRIFADVRIGEILSTGCTAGSGRVEPPANATAVLSATGSSRPVAVVGERLLPGFSPLVTCGSSG
jgi:hypothetical protein